MAKEFKRLGNVYLFLTKNTQSGKIGIAYILGDTMLDAKHKLDGWADGRVSITKELEAATEVWG